MKVEAGFLGEADDEIETPVPLPDVSGGLAADRDLNHILHVGDVEPVARDRTAVDFHGHEREPGHLLRLDVGGAGNLA